MKYFLPGSNPKFQLRCNNGFPPPNRNCCHNINYSLVHETTAFEIKIKEIKRLCIKNITNKSAVILFYTETIKISGETWIQTWVNIGWLKRIK